MERSLDDFSPILSSWLRVLAVCGVAGLFRTPRVLATYVALMVSGGLGLSLALSTLAGLGGWFFWVRGDPSSGNGLVLWMIVLVAFVIGGLAGLVLGCQWARKITCKASIF